MPNFIATAKHAAMAALRLTPPKETPAEAGAEHETKHQALIVSSLLRKVHHNAFTDGLALGLLIGLAAAAIMLLAGGAQ